MVCQCACGREYGFEPLGFWMCPVCGDLNDSGPMGGKRSDVMPPDSVDEMVWDGKEFARHADASVREHPDSPQAWYSLGATYGSRGNVTEAGLFLARAASLVPDGELGAFADRCVRQMTEYVFKAVVMGVRCNRVYAKGLEAVCDGRIGRSFCADLYGMMVGRVAGLMPYEAFSMLNMGVDVMMQCISLHPDIRDHARILDSMVVAADVQVEMKTSNPMRRAACRKTSAYLADQKAAFARARDEVLGAVADVSDAELDALAAKQPGDGTAGFADRLSKAMGKGSELAYMRATKSSDAERSAAESEMSALLSEYVSMYMSGDGSAVPENRVVGI